MIPIILVSDNLKKTASFIKKLVKENGFKASDVFEIRPKEKEISIDQIREIKKSLNFLSKPKLFIIYDFDSSGLEAQNSTLKMLEEKIINQFILLVNNPAKIISTIISRSKIINIKSSANKMNTDRIGDLIKKIKASRDYEFLADALIIKISREDALRLIGDLIMYYKNCLLSDSAAAPAITESITAAELIKTNNVNPQLAIDNLLIFIFKLYSMNNK